MRRRLSLSCIATPLSAALFGLLVTAAASWAQSIFTPLLEPVALPLPPGERSIVRMVQQPDGNVYGFVAADGHQWRFLRMTDEAGGGVQTVPEVPDLVMPPPMLLTAPGLAWHWDAERKQGYVLTEKGRLLLYRADGNTTDLGQVSGTRPFEPEGYQLSRALLAMPTGEIYAAGENGTIFRYAPGAEAVEKLTARLPAVNGREPWASLDGAVIGPDGMIYGGTFDGYIFSFDPQTQVVTNLGKPFRAQHIAALVFRDGILYGIGGGERDIPRVFNYDPTTRGFTLGGLLSNSIKGQGANYYEPVGACAADAAGNIYISTSGRLGNLYVWEAR